MFTIEIILLSLLFVDIIVIINSFKSKLQILFSIRYKYVSIKNINFVDFYLCNVIFFVCLAFDNKKRPQLGARDHPIR